MDVETIASDISDNFFYLTYDDAGLAALIDPVDADKAVARVEDAGLELRWVINTHFHADHAGGNDAVLTRFSAAKLVAGAGDADRIDAEQSHGVDRRVASGDVIELGDAVLDVLDTPGHTSGHISLYARGHLFSGDTVFVGGAGNCSFGGDAGVLFTTFRDVLSDLDNDVVFYPGHDYAVRNLEFIASIEPTNAYASLMLERAQMAGHGDLFLTSLGEERTYSPFFRWDDASLAAHIAAEHAEVFEQQRRRSATPAEALFRTVRELRNRW